MKEFPKVKIGIVDGEELPEITGFTMAFTYPVLVFYVNGKEAFRFARFVPIDQLRQDVKKMYEGVIGVGDGE